MNARYFILFIFLQLIPLKADITMGVVPQQSPLKLLKTWQPIATYLSKQTGEKVIFKTAKSIDIFSNEVNKGTYDFAYMNPYHYVSGHELAGYEAEVRAKKNIRGILVVNKELKKNLRDKDFVFIFPSPKAFAATLLVKYDLIKVFGVSLETLNSSKYVMSHDSVYKNLALGRGDAGGGIMRTFNDPKQKLKIIHKTPSYPSHPFAFKDTMDKKVKNKLVKALLSMPQKLLKKLNMQELKKIQDSEYNGVLLLKSTL